MHTKMTRKNITNQNAILPIAFLMAVACHSPKETAVTPKQPAATKPALAINNKDTTANKRQQKMPHIDTTAGQPLPTRRSSGGSEPPMAKPAKSGEVLVTPADYKKAHILPPPTLKDAPKPHK